MQADNELLRYRGGARSTIVRSANKKPGSKPNRVFYG